VAGHLPEIFSSNRVRWLEPEDLQALDEHVSSCAVCRGLLRAARPRLNILFSLKAELERARAMDEHLADDDLRSYNEDVLGEVERELVGTHLEVCLICQARAERLLKLKQRSE
jgi:hypothetical protein